MIIITEKYWSIYLSAIIISPNACLNCLDCYRHITDRNRTEVMCTDSTKAIRDYDCVNNDAIKCEENYWSRELTLGFYVRHLWTSQHSNWLPWQLVIYELYAYVCSWIMINDFRAVITNTARRSQCKIGLGQEYIHAHTSSQGFRTGPTVCTIH